ncbi:DUF2461 domain-containing protein [Paenibacillus xylanexedens]|uniref:DUF2461 domain-containing protein n=1 Tax=Paenibacillus xylanexedens TaxID=528191 RepID=UPI0011A5CB3E|nr:DUF2461 domain-containing protein [Paenibacillus xylanexedens]
MNRPEFQGFTEEALQFLEQVRENDSKTWYEENKPRYEKLLLDPFKQLVSGLAPDLLLIDPLFEVTPSVNKTISRLYRDTRFSKDKSLYRSTMWFTFKRPKADWLEAPSFFFEISPLSFRYGMGYYSANRESMDIFRAKVLANLDVFYKTIQPMSDEGRYEIEGDKYKRSLHPDLPSELKEWIDRKNLYLVHNSTDIQRLFSSVIADELLTGFKQLEPIYHYLCKVEEQKMASSVVNRS